MAVRTILAVFSLEVMPLEVFMFISGMIVGAAIGVLLFALCMAGRSNNDEDS
jgi:hypothetical protein